MADRVLIVDDEPSIRRVLLATLRRAGYEVTEAADGLAALAALEQDGADVVVTDLVMPRLDGMELLRRLSRERPDVPVIVLTAHGTVDKAVEAMKAGAFDFIAKPWEAPEQVLQVVEKAARQSDLNRVNVVPGRQRELIGASPRIAEVRALIAKAAPMPSTVLITGESGTGKELVAAELHARSRREGKPFIKISCAAIPRELVEAELFGFERGAFTGAVHSKPGRFELADGGTLFLDEIGEVPLEMQVKLLRVLQESEFERVGGLKSIRVDVRLIAATSRNLGEEIKAGRFREDLFYRLNVVPISLPPLRERREDIPALIDYFLEKYNKKLGKTIERFEPEALAVLGRYSWPGNIRELENLCERIILFAEGPTIRIDDVPAPLRTGPPRAAGEELPPKNLAEGMKEIVREQVAALERDLIQKALEETGRNVTQAARLLQISRKSLQMKMKELGLREE